MIKHRHFIKHAILASEMSKDPKTKVGAILVDSSNRILGSGYNGAPRKFNDSLMNWDDRASAVEYVVHAEVNCILQSSARYDERSTLYTTMSPCKECIKIIAAAGISTVVYKDAYKDIEKVCILAYAFKVTMIQVTE